MVGEKLINRLAAVAALLWPFLFEQVVVSSFEYTVLGVATVLFSGFGKITMKKYFSQGIIEESYLTQFALTISLVGMSFLLPGQSTLVFFALSWLMFGLVFITGLWIAKILWSQAK